MASTLLLAAAIAAAAIDFAHARTRRIDEIGHHRLISPHAHQRTRAVHRRMMQSWRPVQELAAGTPTVFPTTYGADPTGKTDSTAPFQSAMMAVLAHNTSSHRMSEGIADLGGVVLDLQGGDYLISSPVIVPTYYGNMRIIDGTIRASPSFPPNRYLIEIGDNTCKNGQASCNENVGMSGLTLDASHVAAGCIQVTATMGATLDSSSAIFGFNQTGIALDGGHEMMIQETWVAAYFWDSPNKEAKDGTVGIGIFGNDHYITNTIVFSAQVGVKLTGAANILNGVHTWNDATGNGGIGILNQMSQNRFQGCYMDFTDLVLTNAEQTSIAGGFFLGGAQILFQAPKAGSSIFGTALTGNEWYDTGSAALAVDESAGTWTAVTDLTITGTTLQQGQPAKPSTRVTKVLKNVNGANGQYTVDFSDVLLFPHVPIAANSVQVQVLGGSSSSGVAPPAAVAMVSNQQVNLYIPTGYDGGFSAVVTVDQSASSTTFAA